MGTVPIEGDLRPWESRPLCSTVRPWGERPSGTVTFLFTGVEDSTGRSEVAAADMATAFQVHDAVVRGAIESQSG